jgi:hypothetical protein
MIFAKVTSMPESVLAVVRLSPERVEAVKRVADASLRTPGEQLSFVVADWLEKNTLGAEAPDRKLIDPEPVAA